MKISAHDFVTVDMRGLKAVLEARARAERVSVSALVRRAVERELGMAADPDAQGDSATSARTSALVKASIRLTAEEVQQLEAGSRRAGLSRGAYLGELLAGVPAVSSASPSLPDRLAALTVSSGELAALSRSVHQLAELLRRGDVQAALQYRRILDTLDADVRVHLRLAAEMLASLRPARASGRGGRAGGPLKRRST